MAQLKDLVVLGKSRFIGDLYANKIVGTIEGKISDADRATSDALDQNIASTYIKNITADGKTITFTKGDGTFASFDTQDTTYAQATADTLGLVRVVGSTGTSTTDVMSQKAVTDALNNIQPEVSNAFVDAALAKDNTGVRRLNFTRGNGSTVEYDLSFAQATDSVLGLVKVTGSTGTSTTDVMSQKAVTDALSNIHVDNALTEVNLTKDDTGTRVLTFTKGDGSTADYDLSFAQATDSVLGLVKVTGSTGTSTTDIMSQKAVTDALGTKVESVSMTKQDNTRKLTFTKGNGTTSEYDLSYNQATDSVLGLVKVTGSTGTSTTDVMSQKAVTDELSAVGTVLDNTLQSVELTKDNTGVRKLTFTKGDGSTAEYDMSFAQATNNVLGLVKVQGSTGTSTTDVMSQKATSDAVNDKLESVSLSKDNTGSRVLTFTKGDGSTVDYDLSFAQATDSVLGLVKVNGSTGTSTTDVMSQKAVTDELSSLDTRLTPIENISSNFTIENGKLCYIASDGTNSGDNSNSTAEPLTLDETLQDIADTLGDISQNISNVSAATAAQTTTDWLNQHVDPSRDVVIDDSLTISGAAADAKVTGDNVRELKSALSGKITYDDAQSDWQSGVLTTGNENFMAQIWASTKAITNTKRLAITEGDTLSTKIPNGWKIRVLFFSNTGNINFNVGYVTKSGDYDDRMFWHTDDRDLVVPTGAIAFACSLAKTDDSDVSPTDLPASLSLCKNGTNISVKANENGIYALKKWTENDKVFQNTIDFMVGNFGTASTPTFSPSATRVTSTWVNVSPGQHVYFTPSTNAKYRVLFFKNAPKYDGNANESATSGYDDLTTWHTDKRELIAPSDASCFVICVAYKNDAAITPADMPIVDCTFNNLYYIATHPQVDDLPLSDYAGKKISILGDSISTFAGNDPESAGDGHTLADGTWTYEGNHCRYPNTYLSDVNDTYWKKIIDFYGMSFGVNESWAGSTVSWNGTESGEQGANKYIASPTRIGHLDDNGTPDIILVNAGTNDIGLNITIGTFNTESPKNYTDEQIAALPVATFADAYRALLIRLQKSYPLARILVMLPNFTTSYYSPTNADLYLEVIKEACDYFGVSWVDMRTCGFNIWNTGTYTGDGIHPNIAGMNLLYECVAKFMQYEM